MFGNQLVTSMITRSSETAADRRTFLRTAGLAGLGVAGAGTLVTATGGAAFANNGIDTPNPDSPATPEGEPISDASILNFALNLEYLEAEAYSYAVYGHGLDAADIDGNCEIGEVTGGAKVPFTDPLLARIAADVARDEVEHVRFLRAALGTAKVSRPRIDLVGAATAAARAAGLIGAEETFNPFADETSFLLTGFLFEDVGVTAYKGAAPLIQSKTYLEAAAGILAVESYHAAAWRTYILQRGLEDAANAISAARDSLDGPTTLDAGVTAANGDVILAPTDENSVAYSRTPGQVLNIVYLNPASTDRGGFFPHGTNGEIRTSAASA